MNYPTLLALRRSLRVGLPRSATRFFTDGRRDGGLQLDTLEPFLPPDDPLAFLRALHRTVHAPAFRRAFGAYYTPRGLAELAVSTLDLTALRRETVLDPGCGAGVFLAASIDRKRAALEGTATPDEVVAGITETVIGIDLDPLAVILVAVTNRKDSPPRGGEYLYELTATSIKSAKLSYLLTLAPELRAASVDRISIPVFLTDALGVTRDDSITFEGDTLDIEADHLVGNPPWITWGDLAERVRADWQQHADRLGLVPAAGTAARLGHSNDDISVSFVWVSLDRYLAPGGDAAVVLKRGLRTGPAGEPFRRGAVGDRSVAVTGVHDFGELRPFDADVDAAVYTLAADTDTDYPIRTVRWRGSERQADFSSLAAMRERLTRQESELVPVDPDRPGSEWVRADAERAALGECEHVIRHGLKDDAKAVFSVDRERLTDIEPDCVYPYLRSKHIVKYGLFGYDLHLVPMRAAGEDNEAELRAECPETYEYLQGHRERLSERSSAWLDSGPFYNLFGLGEYTWAPYKLVWCRLGFKPHFAVVSSIADDDLGEKPVVPGDHCMFVATDDREAAHYLCALLNSAPYQRCLRDLSSGGKASLSKSLVSKLALPTYRGTDGQCRLAELSMRAHEIVPEHTDVSKRTYNARRIEPLQRVQAEIDDIVATWLDS